MGRLLTERSQVKDSDLGAFFGREGVAFFVATDLSSLALVTLTLFTLLVVTYAVHNLYKAVSGLALINNATMQTMCEDASLA